MRRQYSDVQLCHEDVQFLVEVLPELHVEVREEKVLQEGARKNPSLAASLFL